MDWKRFMEGTKSYPLYIDIWDHSPPKPALIGEQSINFVDLGKPCPPDELPNFVEHEISSGKIFTDDCMLLALLHEFYPSNPGNETLHELQEDTYYKPFKVMYFDFPGHDEESWKEVFVDQYSKGLPRKYHDSAKTYVHPFIYEDTTHSDREERYEFVLQYWLFYLTNDGGNNHEGDWEHINVIISPLDKINRRLTAGEIQSILEGNGLQGAEQGEQLVIQRSEFYFHHYVMILDYTRPNVYLPKKEWEDEVNGLTIEKFGEQKLWERIREMAYWDDEEKIINTHPVGHIGADNKGFDQVLSMPGGKNRDSHGTYPFAGLYKGIGPAGASEQITTYVDHRKYYADSGYRSRIDRKKHGRGGLVRLDKPERIEIVPDWERVVDLAQENSEVRRNWSWLILPIRWGYPASVSPFAGVVAHAETGNLSPVGPAFNDGWNRVRDGQGYSLYEPHRFSWLFPLEWQDSFQNSLGFLNLTIPTLINLPPFDLAWRLIAAPFRSALANPSPTFYTTDNIPYRSVGLTGGVAIQKMPDEFINLLLTSDEAFAEVLFRIIEADPDFGTVQTKETVIIDDAISAYFELDLFLGKRFVTYNAIRHSRSLVGADYFLTNRSDPFQFRSDLNLWEYTGSIRYNLATGGFQPYIKGGWGLSWYRLENLSADGVPLENAETAWIRKPSFFPFKNLLPNTWNYGAGLELLLIRSHAAIPRGIDVGLRAEWTGYYHSLGLDLEATFLDFTTRKIDLNVTRNEFKFVLSLSF